MSLIQKAKDKKENLLRDNARLAAKVIMFGSEIEKLKTKLDDLAEIRRKYERTLDENIRLSNKVEELEAALQELAE